MAVIPAVFSGGVHEKFKYIENMAVTIAGGLIVALLLVFGTILTGRSASADTEKADQGIGMINA